MHFLKRTQIVHLKADEALTKVFNKFADSANLFLLNLIAKFLKHKEIINHIIKLIDDKQPLYYFIYSLGLIELKTLKTCIETNLANGFIKSSKSLTSISIVFDKKPDRSLKSYIDYRGLNNLTINN